MGATKTKPALRQLFNGVSIRPARAADLEAVFNLLEKVFPEEMVEPLEPKKTWTGKLIEKSRTAHSDTTFPVAVNDNDQPIGTALGIKYSNGVGLIGDLGLMEEYRGHGLGRELLDRVSRSLRRKGADCLVLEVFADNEPAINLYKSAGFVKTTKRIRNLHGTGKKGLQMAKWF